MADNRIDYLPYKTASIEFYSIPTRSLRAYSKQFCLDDLAFIILIALVIHRL